MEKGPQNGTFGRYALRDLLEAARFRRAAAVEVVAERGSHCCAGRWRCALRAVELALCSRILQQLRRRGDRQPQPEAREERRAGGFEASRFSEANESDVVVMADWDLMDDYDPMVVLCEGCSMNVMPVEWFRVRDEVRSDWMQRVLCVGCLEAEIGRRLKPEDFYEMPINDSKVADSPRLRDRKGPGRCSIGRYYAAVDHVIDGGWSVEVAAHEWNVDTGLLQSWVDSAVLTAQWAAEDEASDVG